MSTETLDQIRERLHGTPLAAEHFRKYPPMDCGFFVVTAVPYVVLVAVDQDDEENNDTPPREGAIGDIIVAGPGPRSMISRPSCLHMHSKSWDCWYIMPDGRRVREVMVHDPYAEREAAQKP